MIVSRRMYLFMYNIILIGLSYLEKLCLADTRCVQVHTDRFFKFNKSNASCTTSNYFTRSSEDENKNTINKIYARLAVVARVDLWDASYSFRDGAYSWARPIARMR